MFFFIKLNNKDVDKSILKGTLRLFFGTNNAHVTKVKLVNSEKETFAILSLSKTVPIPIFENPRSFAVALMNWFSSNVYKNEIKNLLKVGELLQYHPILQPDFRDFQSKYFF